MFTGTWNYIKLILRRDRVKLPVWIISISLSLLAMIPLLKNVYGSSDSINAIFQTFSTNPAVLFLTGPMDQASFGALMTIETVLWWGLAMAFMNIFLVVRHTRQNEDIGAQELIMSGRAHRSVSLTSTLIVALVTNAIIALIVSIGVNIAGINDAWLYGCSLGLFGMVWAVVTAIIVQLVGDAHSATGMATGLVGLTFVLRGIGDFLGKTNASGVFKPAWPSLASPFGWLQSSKAITSPDWQGMIIPAIFVIVVIPLAYFLLSRRDLGSGILPSRKGHAKASSILKTPLGLTLKLQKNIFLGWFIGVFSMAVIIGMLVPEMSKVYEGSPDLQAIITALGGTGALIPTFLAAMLAIIVLMIAAYVIQSCGKLRNEEYSGHLENLLGTKLSRIKWFALHVGTALIGGAIMLAVSGATLAICANIGVDGFNANVLDYTLAGLSYFPILLLFVGIYVALFGLLPKAAGLVSWVYFGFVVFVSWIAPMLKLDDWVMNLSPLSHMASAPAEDIKVAPLLVISGIAVALITTGLVAWRRRNLVERQ